MKKKNKGKNAKTAIEDFIINLSEGFWEDFASLPNPEQLFMYQGFQTRQIWLEGEITWESVAHIIKYIQLLNITSTDLETPIVLHISSPGGELATMFSLYYTMKQSKIPVHTVNECNASSAALLIFLAGEKRTMLPEAFFVAHEGSGVIGGNYRESKSAMEKYDKDVLRMKNVIVNETELTMEDLNEFFKADQDWYIDYEIAEEFGFITDKHDPYENLGKCKGGIPTDGRKARKESLKGGADNE